MPAVPWRLFGKTFLKDALPPCPRSVQLSLPQRLSGRWQLPPLPLPPAPCPSAALSSFLPPPRRIPRSRPVAPSASPSLPGISSGDGGLLRALRPRGASAPLFLPAVCRRSAHVPAPPRCSAPGRAPPRWLRAWERSLPLPRPVPPPRPPARPGGNAPARSWRCGCLPRLRGASGCALCGKVVCLPGERRGTGVRRGGRGGKTTTQNCLHEFPSARPASEISPIRAVRGGSQLTFPHHFTVTFGRQARWSAQTRN